MAVMAEGTYLIVVMAEGTYLMAVMADGSYCPSWQIREYLMTVMAEDTDLMAVMAEGTRWPHDRGYLPDGRHGSLGSYLMVVMAAWVPTDGRHGRG
jgi:hypothetical protein